jgi:hypothetical protein
MNEVLLSNQVIVYLLSESTLFFLLLVAFLISIKILKKWNFNSFNPLQFKLEKESYLINTITLFVFGLKFLLLLYFIFTIDALSLIVSGAMCGAGVIDANQYGTALLSLKLFILFLLTLWLYLNFYDMRTKDYKYFKEKSWLFSAIFLLIFLEIYLDFQYFTNINTHIPVSCCSTLFGQLEGANPLPFGLNISLLLVLFYLLYILLLTALYSGYKLLYIGVNLLFVYVAYYAVVYFFGTYIYQLPTHKCPFCMLQVEYFYVGYLLWGSLFIGTFLGLSDVISSLWLQKEKLKNQKLVARLLSLFVLLCTLYVVVYYVNNGLLL